MTVRTGFIIGSVWFTAICFIGEVRAQTYVWQRSLETVTAHSEAKWTLQNVNGKAVDPSDAPEVGLDGFASSELSHVGDSQPVRAGSGGNGGGGASAMAGGVNGADGFTGGAVPVPVDGTAGASPLAAGGAGGQAGDDGEATADINANGIVELNPDGQAVLSWSYIHNQDAELLLRGAGGGGGGGGGSAFAGMGAFQGGNGGLGGGGQSALGQLRCVQTSTADVDATLSRGPDADGNTPNTTTARVYVDLGWSSTGTETGTELFDFPDEPWDRRANIIIQLGNNAMLTITGGPTGPIYATGTVNGQTTFQKSSVNSLNDATGSFGIGLSEFPVTLTVGEEISIFSTTGDAKVSSTLQIQDATDGGMSAPGGVGGEGGGGDGGDGEDGFNPGNALGGGGGDGGAGGLGFQGAWDGGSGGRGGDGHKNDTQRNGLFQGVVEIHLDQ